MLFLPVSMAKDFLTGRQVIHLTGMQKQWDQTGILLVGKNQVY